MLHRVVTGWRLTGWADHTGWVEVVNVVGIGGLFSEWDPTDVRDRVRLHELIVGNRTCAFRLPERDALALEAQAGFGTFDQTTSPGIGNLITLGWEIPTVGWESLGELPPLIRLADWLNDGDWDY